MIGLFTKNFQCLCLLSFAVACSAPVSNKTIKTVVKPSVQIEVASDRDNSNDFCEKILSGDAWARWANLLIDTYGLPERCQTITGDGHRNLDGPIIGTVTMPWDEFIYVFEAMPPETTIRTLVITKPSKKIDDWISKNRDSLLLESIKMDMVNDQNTSENISTFGAVEDFNAFYTVERNAAGRVTRVQFTLAL